MKGAWLAATALAGAFLAPAGASAQGVARYDVAVGARWIAPVALGTADARLTTAGGGSLTFFETESEMEEGRAIEASMGVRLAGPLRVEALVSAGRSRMSTRITGDLEGAAGVTASQAITEIAVGAGVVTELPAALASRVVPFVVAAAFHLRHLHEGRPLVETGRMYHLGGGVDLRLRAHGSPAVGLRGDVRAVIRTDGALFDDRPRTAPAVGASLFFRF